MDGDKSKVAQGEKVVALEDLRKKMAEFARERDWEQFHSPRNLLLALVVFSNKPSFWFLSHIL
jgi:dCTP diphosphatase